jgi:hypothetical protein
LQTEGVVGSSPESVAPAADPAERRMRSATGTYTLIAAGLTALAFLLRLGLIVQGWPATNSDEGVTGLMARHIAYRGEHPIFFYGQNYMGPHEAVLGAALFHLFGPSLFILRLGMLLLFVGFLVSSYQLIKLVYSATWALVCLALLGLGSAYIVARELSAIGGYPETLLFGSLLFLLASWLVLTYQPYRSLREGRWRIAAYLAWGAIAGTSIWDHLLGAPFVLMSGVLLAVFCWRELLRMVAPSAALGGLVLGMFPLIYYNLRAKPGADTLSTLQWVRGTPPGTWAAQIEALWRSVTISVPMMTGLPFCEANELAALGPTTSYSRACVVTRDAWGAGYMLLLTLAILLACWGLWWAWRSRRAGRGIRSTAAVLDAAGPDAAEGDATRRVRRRAIHLAMLTSAAITFYLYAFSTAPVDWPGIHGRYLLGFLIAMPAVFWPLWQGVASARRSLNPVRRTVRIACVGALAAYCGFLVIGTVETYRQVPAVKEGNRRDAALIDTLARHDVAHIYSDYWTCSKITFLSNERAICAVVDGQLNDAMNRYRRYWDLAKADPRAAYVFTSDSTYVARQGDTYTIPAVEERARKTGATYQIRVIDGYVIYLAS